MTSSRLFATTVQNRFSPLLRGTCLVAALSLLISSCGGGDGSDSPFSGTFPLEVPQENSLQAKWAGKEVLSSKLVDDMEGRNLWTASGIATIQYTTAHSIDGTHSLRYCTSMLDMDHIESHSERTPWGSFGGEQGGEASFSLVFDEPQDWSSYNRVSIWVYIHPSRNPNVHFFLDVTNEGTDYDTLTPRHDTNIDIPQGKWCNVLWEIDCLPRDRVSSFTVFQTLIGYDREMGEQYVTIDFDRLELQKVVPDHYSGWDVPEGEIAFSHVGYRPHDNKVALSAANLGNEFFLLDGRDEVAFTGQVSTVSNKGNSFAVLDFTSFTSPGTYRIRYGGAISRPFPIGEDVWLHPMFSAINFYYCQRCGYEVPGIHGVCHRDFQGFHGDEVKVINGGWHDAGDLSQGFYRTALGCYTLMMNLEVVRADRRLGDLASKLRAEASWGVQWLLDTRFHGGYHISWARQRIYSDNVIGTPDDVMVRAQSVPWENFLGSCVFLMAEDDLPAFADRKGELRDAAVDNWDWAMSSREKWDKATYLEASWGAIASCALYLKTGEDRYREAALHFGDLLLGCQERVFRDGIPITGYFYTDSSSSTLLHSNHGAFNEAPLLAFRYLCGAFPQEGKWIEWFSAATIYSEYFIKRGSRIAAPYNLLPNGVFRRSDIPATPSGDYALIQYDAGTPLGENYALRTFPIWNGNLFHGGTSCHLSTTWALAEASSLLGDRDGMDLVQEQLEWTFGRNPFSQSFMYGVGYDFAPMFVYCTHNIVGALPVGIDSFKDDEPFWHGSAYATSKEIWIAPVNRFMGSVAAFLRSRPHRDDISLTTDVVDGQAVLDISGEGTHNLTVLFSNAGMDSLSRKLTLGGDGPARISFPFSPEDPARPCVGAVVLDGNYSSARMITTSEN